MYYLKSYLLFKLTDILQLLHFPYITDVLLFKKEIYILKL